MLHLTIEHGDKIFVGEGDNAIVVSLGRVNSRGQVTLSFNAPKEIPIHTIFADESQQFKNRRHGQRSQADE